MSGAYYNEFDKHAAAWLRELIKAGLIADGEVDERSIVDVRADELTGFTQCHFFAGIGGWSYALRLAGWPDSREVWTASCPCQPYSSAGKQKGDADERNLWPAYFALVRERQPERMFGEQVANAIGHGWLDGIFADLESEAYTCGAIVLGAHSAGAPHIRQRLFWLADAEGEQFNGRGATRGRRGESSDGSGDGWQLVSFAADCEGGDENELGETCSICGDDYAECDCPGPTQDGFEYREFDGRLYARGLEHAINARPQGFAGDGNNGSEPGRLNTFANRPTATAGSASHWSAFDLIPCADRKARRIESGTFPLAHGIPARVGRLRGYGNAIVPQVAAEFIAAYMTIQPTIISAPLASGGEREG